MHVDSAAERSAVLVTDGVMRCASVRFHAWSAGIIFPEANHPTQSSYDVSARFPELVPATIDALRDAAWSNIATAFDATLVHVLADTPSGVRDVYAARHFFAYLMVRTLSAPAALRSGKRSRVGRPSAKFVR